MGDFWKTPVGDSEFGLIEVAQSSISTIPPPPGLPTITQDLDTRELYARALDEVTLLRERMAKARELVWPMVAATLDGDESVAEAYAARIKELLAQ